MNLSSLPSGLPRDDAGYARRKDTVPRNDDAAWLGRMLEHVMISAMPRDPTVALELGYDCVSVCVRLDHERLL
jgi:hypothetical protein